MALVTMVMSRRAASSSASSSEDRAAVDQDRIARRHQGCSGAGDHRADRPDFAGDAGLRRRHLQLEAQRLGPSRMARAMLRYQSWAG